jgi:hypothetical protein
MTDPPPWEPKTDPRYLPPLLVPWWKLSWFRIEHRIHFWRHRELHASHCVCLGTGRFR